MATGIARKYVKAVLASCSDAELNEIKEGSAKLAPLFKYTRFREIMVSPIISTQKKLELLTEISGIKSAKGKNFLGLLAEKGRFDLIPSIYEELRVESARKSGTYEGQVLASAPVTDADIKTLESNLSKAVGATISITSQESGYDGFKVDVPDLGIEVDFSQKKLKNQLLSHILKGI